MIQSVPVSVIITTLNEAKNLPRCLAALKDFDEVIVVDSHSSDETPEVARQWGTQVVLYKWDGKYPKKRQWCLDTLKTKNDFIFFVDADEKVTPELINEIRQSDFAAAGYFVKGQYVWNGRPLRHGLMNNKLCLINRHKMEFPVVDDLDIPGMGEIEGHYQPVLKSDYVSEKIDQMKSPLLHYAYGDIKGWQARHERYAVWEAEMMRRNGYPPDPVAWRQVIKRCIRGQPVQKYIAFLHSYVLKKGFCDGRAGYEIARSRFAYYKSIQSNLQ